MIKSEDYNVVSISCAGECIDFVFYTDRDHYSFREVTVTRGNDISKKDFDRIKKKIDKIKCIILEETRYCQCSDDTLMKRVSGTTFKCIECKKEIK